MQVHCAQAPTDREKWISHPSDGLPTGWYLQDNPSVGKGVNYCRPTGGGLGRPIREKQPAERIYTEDVDGYIEHLRPPVETIIYVQPRRHIPPLVHQMQNLLALLCHNKGTS